MCKVFKIKTKTGLVTTTTDQSIVKCLMDNYDDELTVTISKENKPIDKSTPTELDVSEAIQFDLLSYSGTNTLHYVKELKDILQITTYAAKNLSDNGGTVHVFNAFDAQLLETVLERYNVVYTRFNSMTDA